MQNNDPSASDTSYDPNYEIKAKRAKKSTHVNLEGGLQDQADDLSD